MPADRIVRLLVSGLLLAGASGVLALGAMLVSHSIGGSGADAGLLAWTLAFAVILPVGVLVVMAAILVSARGRISRTVPNMGWTIPGKGQ